MRALLLWAQSEGNYVEPAWFKPLMQLNDRYGFILWPALTLVVMGIIALGALAAASHRSIPGLERARLKQAILHELRRHLDGMSLEQIARLIGYDRARTRELVEEMARDAMVDPSLGPAGATVYRLRGS